MTSRPRSCGAAHDLRRDAVGADHDGGARRPRRPSVSTVRMPCASSSAMTPVVVDDLAQRVRRLALRGGQLGVVDRLADAVAEAGAARDPDFFDRSHCPASIAPGRDGPVSAAGRVPASAVRPGLIAVAMTLVDEGRDAPHELRRWRPPAPGGGGAHGSATRWKGRPTRTVMRAPMLGNRAPRPRKRSDPEMPTGRTGTPVRVASSAAPGSALPERPVCAARALREDDQRLARLKEPAAHAVGVRVAATGLDADRALPLQEPRGGSDEDLFLGQEARAAPDCRRQPARDERRVGVAQMVGGDDQRTGQRQVPGALHPDAGHGREHDPGAEGEGAGDGRAAWAGTCSRRRHRGAGTGTCL